MRYTITNQHINFYVEYGYIEFEELINPKLLEDAKKSLGSITNIATPLDTYKTGRDLFRKNTIFEKIVKDPSLVQIAKTLTKENKFKLAFDQIYTTCKIFESEGTFEEYFSFQDLTCLVIIRLDNTILEDVETFQAPSKFSNVVFVNPQLELDLSSLQIENQCLLFIGYGSNRTLYIHNQNDLNNTFLKQFGYGYGDRLKQAYHPYL